MADFKAIAGCDIIVPLFDEDMIVMAVNTRITVGVVKGIMRAAKDVDSPVFFELAKSECDLKGGYTGLTPAMFSKAVHDVAREVGFDVWALHADHLTLKKGTPEEIASVKQLIEAQVAAGYTSFAIDASFLFDEAGKSVSEHLKRNIEVTTEIAKFIEEKMAGKRFGLEVEVGEIGKKDAHGRVLTTPEEAVTFIKALNANGVFPQVLAIANGSAHGNVYDAQGNAIEQVSIDIGQTIAIADALEKAGLQARLAQHGITGTPRELIYLKFPKKAIVKGNVGTFWQNIVWDVFKICEPKLYQDIFDWTIKTYREQAAKKGMANENQIFGTYSKQAIGARDENGKFIFYDRIYGIGEETKRALEAMAYAEALLFFKAFNAKGSASIVRKSRANS